MLKIDPYVYRHLSFDDIKIMDTVAHIITGNHEDFSEDLIVETILKTFKSGMKARALQIHVQRLLSLSE